MKIIITGGASGLGKAITEKLGSTGEHEILISFHSAKKSMEELVSRINGLKGVHLDLLDEKSIDDFIKEVEVFQPDCIINNAYTGGIHKDYFHKTSSEIYQHGFSKNILPVIKINQEVIKIFRKKKFGKIITVLSSVLINKPPIGWSEYTASKAYLHSLTKSWAVENSQFKITSNCVSPSFMETALTSDTDERILEEMKNAHPLKKILTVEEVADSVHFLVNASLQVNGVNIIMNSGDNIQ